MRLSSNVQRQAAFGNSVSSAAKALSPERARQLEAVVPLLFAPSARQIMRDHWGLSGREGGKVMSWAIHCLPEAVRQETEDNHVCTKSTGRRQWKTSRSAKA